MQDFNYRVCQQGGPGSALDDYDNLSATLTAVREALADSTVHFVSVAKVAPLPVVADENGTRTRGVPDLVVG